MGTVFNITAGGAFSSLHSFATVDGAFLWAGVVQDAQRNIYGTASQGGANSYGTVFKIAPDGTFAILHSFAKSDGAYPTAY